MPVPAFISLAHRLLIIMIIGTVIICHTYRYLNRKRPECRFRTTFQEIESSPKVVSNRYKMIQKKKT
jgi:hypothetical protein